MMIDIKDGKTSYGIIHQPILVEFNLSSEEIFMNLLNKIESSFNLASD